MILTAESGYGSAVSEIGGGFYGQIIEKQKGDHIIYRTGLFAVYVCFVCSDLSALLTNIGKGRNFFKNVYYLPCVLSSAALGLLWMFIFSPKLGINQILAQWGIQGPLWLIDVKGFINLPMKVIAFVALWQYVGQSMMLYMAQISGIDKSLYEAS